MKKRKKSEVLAQFKHFSEFLRFDLDEAIESGELKSYRAVAEKCGLGNSYITRLTRTETYSSDLLSLTKLSLTIYGDEKYLPDIWMSFLYREFGAKPEKDEVEVSDVEMLVLDNWRKLDDKNKKKVIDTLREAAEENSKFR